MLTALEISNMISKEIEEWHIFQANRPENYVIVNENVRQIRPLGQHRQDIVKAIKELVDTNCEMWHEEDKVRSADDKTVLKAIRNINPLNQHRNDLIEEVDEILIAKGDKK